jgi:mono/diheme cytochrome c family protein
MKYIAALFLLFISAFPAHGAESLTLSIGTDKRVMTAPQLLADPKTRDISIADPSYKKTMHYRALPLSALLAGMKLPPDSVIEAVANDGFVAQLPTDLLLNDKTGAAQAFLAIEPPDTPWPALPGKKASAGPFYIVWLNASASGIRSEQWPFMIAALRSADSPAKRWKELAVDPALPAAALIRAGQALFVTQCMACHKLNGAGSSAAGPDLNLPASPTEYFKPDALKKYIRNPASLRHWDGMQMPGFDKDALSDHEIDLIISYMEHMSTTRKTAK